ncbi:hypothetical protein [Longimicrobium terrae]|uniref:Uncharacterized protein n=1 Tax=Longimicrobium terrae TaxID=1639882 RepID=A0A841H597_9BACT|nr:hypothetical protein [Longimicrobium terrae]MBB4638909.1 hypothetical protein [Longimicrobium terrae]MBB6073148.1 hypothetical protein [Longimicrobium terrae]NNC30165.1 hypothetical protein [Longimicrobium terrae]
MARGRFWRQMLVFALTWACADAVALVIAVYGFEYWDEAIGRELSLTISSSIALVLLPVPAAGYGCAWRVVRAWPGVREPHAARRIAIASAVLAAAVPAALDLAEWKWRAASATSSYAPLLLLFVSAPAWTFLFAGLTARGARRGSPGAPAPSG